MKPLISIIIPIGPNDIINEKLINCLAMLEEDVEIIFISCSIDKIATAQTLLPHHNVNYFTVSTSGRALFLNTGAYHAKGNFLWFLHADCSFSKNAWIALKRYINTHPKYLLYFNLAFTQGKLMQLNAIGAKFRSNYLGLPFGDQGFCIAKDIFHRVEGFPENSIYGEDHLFVWQLKLNAIPIQCTETTISTSSRKYLENGWLKITLLHQYLWIKQAFPLWIQQIRKKWV